jgi:hypothetical protein
VQLALALVELADLALDLGQLLAGARESPPPLLLGADAGSARTRCARYCSTPPGSALTVPSPMSEAVTW